MNDRKPSSVPVIPNAALVRGKLISVKGRPDGGSDFDIVVDKTSDVPGYPNFARSYIGQAIRVSIQPGLQHALKENESIEARVAYRGDERGGRFTLLGDHLQKL